jgi:uncharacterized damage-inducible protein DinB
MNWRELITFEMNNNYATTRKLFEIVDDGELSWKPETGDNWMTTGQLLQHLATANEMVFKGFATGDWGIPTEQMAEMSPEEMLPPAEKLPTVASVKEALAMLEKDQKAAESVLADCSDEQLATQPAPAPWDQDDIKLGHRLLHMVGHLQNHKGQLFYYLKLMGKSVNTQHLYGM